MRINNPNYYTVLAQVVYEVFISLMLVSSLVLKAYFCTVR